MLNFEYRLPTRIVFGKGMEEQAGEEIKKSGGTKVLVHYGGHSAEKTGLLAKVCRILEESQLPYVLLGGVKPNPRLSKIYEGIALAKKENVDFILAVGGGSVIDSAKGIGYGVANEGDVWDFYIRKKAPKACVPVGVILTIAASGSETSDGSVVTNENGNLKRDVGSDYARPKFAIMNPELTYSLPEYQTASGSTDILMHAMERYFTTVKNVELIDGFLESLMKTVMHNVRIVLENPCDYNARAELMLAGSFCHNGLLTCGRKGDWASHAIEHELGGMFDVAHGAGLAAVWGSWARYVYFADVMRFAQFAVNVMGCVMDYQNPEKTALEGICAMERFFTSIHMPTSISQMGIILSDEQIECLAEKCTDGGSKNIGAFCRLGKEDIRKIYTMAR
jgi:alcohol dehydrogenase YqhD (iron-dependent ADH family)